MTKKHRIQSIQQLIEMKNKRLDYTRTPYLREYLLQDIADLKQVEMLFAALKNEMRQLKQDYAYLHVETEKLKCAMKCYGLSEDEIYYYSITDIKELHRLWLRAKVFGEYKTPQRFLTTNNVSNEPEIPKK